MAHSRLLRVSEVADRLSTSTATVYRRLREGELKPVRLSAGPSAHLRVAEAELEAWLTRNSQGDDRDRT